ncbi:MAG: hypothetical protein HZA22_01545 [Nitrospirae bacterium]|nr:hypothetical protein [Nitrospirota bacterium]MBI5695175.1 hypothetical protein [Nitrospirota bacterium]
MNSTTLEKAKVFLLGMLTAGMVFIIMGAGGGSGRYEISAAGTSSAVYLFMADSATGEVTLIDGDGDKVWTR